MQIAYLLPDPAVPGLNYNSGVFFSDKISDVAVLIDNALLSVSGQRKA